LRDGRVIATTRRPVGARDSVLSSQPSPLAGAVREAIAEVARAAPEGAPPLVVAAGMLSSEAGIAPVPHVAAPAGIDEIAAGVRVVELPDVCAEPLLIVPGVRSGGSPGADGWTDADVMRGEECETLGAWNALPEARGKEVAFLWPGSHTKLVAVDPGGRIVRSHTTLAGELTLAVARHTLVASGLPEELPAQPDPDALAAGARAVDRGGLGRAAFLVRVAALGQTLGATERAAFWVGAVIADDVRWLAAHPILSDGRPVWVGGRQPQRALYAELLSRRRAAPVFAVDDALAEDASALGALAVALRRVGSPT
jgi:2-dehydro-3-deoxygalactonokinase